MRWLSADDRLKGLPRHERRPFDHIGSMTVPRTRHAAAHPLTGAWVEVWRADHEGRYSGFRPFLARPGQVVTSKSVPREVVAPSETFLRGSQRTDERGMCAFDTIYPGR